MIKTSLIGIDGYNKISEIIYLLLKNNKYNPVLVKDDYILVNDNKLDNISDETILKIYERNKYNNNITILDMNEPKKYNQFMNSLSNPQIDYLININSDKPKEKKSDNFFLYKNVKKNGVIIADSDSKFIFNYFDDLKNKIIVTYGLSPKSTLTASSLDINSSLEINNEIYHNICLQRGITTFQGNDIEPIEFSIRLHNEKWSINNVLAIIGIALLYDIDITDIQNKLFKIYN